MTLSVDNLPSHTHTISGSTASESSHTHTQSGTFTTGGMSGNSTGSIWVRNTQHASGLIGEKSGAFDYTTGTNTNTVQQLDSSGYNKAGLVLTINVSHTHSVTISGSTKSGTSHSHGVGTLENSSVGSGTAHDNMPPYLVRYCWERTN